MDIDADNGGKPASRILHRICGRRKRRGFAAAKNLPEKFRTLQTGDRQWAIGFSDGRRTKKKLVIFHSFPNLPGYFGHREWFLIKPLQTSAIMSFAFAFPDFSRWREQVYGGFRRRSASNVSLPLNR
jgi:hypothetical protein